MHKQSRFVMFAAVFVAVACPRADARGTLDLLFSEYVEGTGNNKAVEIYNAGSLPVDFAASTAQVRIYNNGAITPNSTIALTGVLNPGETYVLANTSAVFAGIADQLSGSVNFNGDDAVELVAAGVPLDVIGQIGFDPGVQWGTSPLDTLDQTLRRLPNICQGDSVGNDPYDPGRQWLAYVTDSFDGLGEHAANCQPVCFGDIVQNGAVDLDDLLAVINSWGDGGGPADVTNSNLVDIDDLLAVIGAWGPCD